MKEEDIKWLSEQFQQVRKEKAELAILVHKLFHRMTIVEIMLTKTKGFTKRRLETAKKDADRLMSNLEALGRQKMADQDIAEYKKYLPKIS